MVGVSRASAGISIPSASAIRPTIQLTLAGLLVAVVLGVSLGIVAALFHNTWIDTGAMVVALLGVSMPIFYFGLLLLFAFSFEIHLFPATGAGSWQHLVLPAIAVGFASSALIARLVRSSMLEVLRQDFVVTARAKGLVERIVVLRHALSNALIPTVTVIGLAYGNQLGGAVLTETIFAWPGIGRYAYQAAASFDFPAIMGVTMLIAAIYIGVNLVVDILYAYLNPKIRYSP